MPKLPHQHNDEHNLEQIIKQSEQIEDFQRIAELLGKMGDPKRVQIFWILCHCEECVTDLSAIVGMSSPAVSHHLKVLRENGLIESRREGKEVCYRAADNELTRLMHTVTEEIMAVSCPDAEINSGNHCSCHNHKKHGSEIKEISSCCLPHPSGQGETSSVAGISAHAQSKPGVNAAGSGDSDYETLAREIHDYLSENLDRHITIESLSRQFHVNPTTIKTVFKKTYGNSIAAHTKEHRMEKAAKLLKTTGLSIAEISAAVGFQTQSKFTQAFKETYHVLPRDYRG